MEFNNKLECNQRAIIIFKYLFMLLITSILTFSLPVLILQIFMGLISLTFILNTDYKTAKLWINIFGISMLFVFLVFLANHMYYGEPYFIGGSDDLKFEQWGFDVYNSGIYNPTEIMEQRIIGLFNNSVFFTVYIARLIQFAENFGGYTTFLPRVANVHFFLWICMIMKHLLERYTNLSIKSIQYSLIFFAFMPNIQYINAHVFRDTFNLLQVLLIALLFDIFLNREKYMLKLTSIALMPFLVYFTYCTRASSILFAGSLVLFMVSTEFRIKTRYIIVIVLPVILLSNLLDSLRLDQIIGVYSNYLSQAADDGLSSIVFNRPLIPLGVIFRATYAFISPFPNFFLFTESSKVLLDLIHLLRNFGVFVQIIFIPFVIKRVIKLDWLSMVFLSWFIAIVISTFTFRHFLFYYPFMTALAVDGYTYTKPKTRKFIILVSIIITFCFGLLYLSLKLLL